MSKRITITAALPYTNGPIHIGHLAGVYVPADIYARYLRLQEHNVAFICGSDEHGVPITLKAKKEGITPQDVVDKYDAIIRKSFNEFGITFDNYSRTSAKIHHETASEFFKTLYDKGEFIEEITEQLYDADADQFLADRFVVGTCPKCGNEESYGDQCEVCGTSHNATDLINPKSVISGAVPSLKKTKHWFLPLDKHESFLKEWILEGHKNDWKPNVYGQLVGGNLTLLHTMLGSDTSINTDGKILFIEEIGEYKYHIDRMLQSLKRAGYFDNCKGLIVGDMSKMRKNTTLWGSSVEQLILDALKECDFPILFGFPAGHEDDNRALILGRNIELSVSKESSNVNFKE